MPLPLEPNISRTMVHAFVVDFYSRVRNHDILGPIFEERLEGHWDAHFEKLTDFWMTVLGGIPAYKGNPFGAHHQVVNEGKHRMAPGHFDHWLNLFDASTNETLPEPLAAIAQVKARRIADSLRQGLFYRPKAAE
ncbi:MAG: group III truncated hemoglobin [Alphaproteobacteria bacterium]|nr:group III truncated hemoglobin [Alphaproteobacteria bacterium]